MLKVLETTPNRIVVKEVRSTYDARILAVFNYSATYLLLFFALKLWSRLDSENIFLKYYIYDIVRIFLFYYFYVIALLLFSVTLLSMLPFGSWFPTRTFTFDCKNNLLTIEFHCLFWHHKIEYSLNDIQSIQWISQPVYTGGMTVVNVPFLKLIRRKQNGKTHLIPIRHTTGYSGYQETSTTVDLINSFLVSKNQHQ
jgi:hypothetical protein